MDVLMPLPPVIISTSRVSTSSDWLKSWPSCRKTNSSGNFSFLLRSKVTNLPFSFATVTLAASVTLRAKVTVS